MWSGTWTPGEYQIRGLYKVSIMLSAEQNTCKPSAQMSLRNLIFFLLHLRVRLLRRRSFDTGWLFSILFPFWSFLFFFVHLLFRGAPTLSQSSVLCSALHSPSGNNLVTLCLLLILFYYSFFNVIDPFSNMQVCAWCSVYWCSDWHKLFKLFFFFFPLEVNSKDIGGWVGGELGVGCRARVKGGWQTRLNCFKIALCPS